MGSSAIAISFFALFGSVFALTQYLQFVQGYTPLEAGVRMIPVALGIMIGAGRSHILVRKIGSTRVVTIAMIGLTLVLGSIAFWTTETSYWIIGTTLFLLTLMMGNILATSTDSVMGAVPEEKAGVGSAMNDIAREVGGALGVAVIGSALNTVYADRMSDTAATLPPEAAEPAQDSIGPAIHIAANIGGDLGASIVRAADNAFVDGLGFAVVIASATALVGAALVARFMPPIELEHSEPTK
jgi:Na+/melibiose symporter-like transporter